jgi:hypothetical protein
MDEVWAASGREDSLRDLYDTFEDTALDDEDGPDESATTTETETPAPEDVKSDSPKKT